MGARLTVEIDGKQVPWDQTDWVIFNGKGFPVGFMRPERGDLSNDGARAHKGPRTAVASRAWRRFWGGDSDRMLRKAQEQYSIKLIQRGPDFDVLLDQHLGKVPVGQETLPEDKE